MSDTKFTPGPWAAIYNDHYFDIRASSTAGKKEIERHDPSVASVTENPHYPHTLGRESANAHLVAAAPELYEALESLMELEKRDRVIPIGPEWDAARAALAKARGKS